MRTVLVSAAAVAAPFGAVSFAAAAQAATVPATATVATATTIMTDHLDSGFSGDNWATDTITRKAAVTLVGKDSNTNDCGHGAAVCYTYTGTISDTGTAVGIKGHLSPGAQATPIKGHPSAHIVGGESVNFHASSNAPSGRLVPTTMSGNSESTDSWVEQFFAQGTSFGDGPSVPSWGWSYTDSGDCQSWVDADDVGMADSGDITGTDECPIVTHGETDADGTHATVTWQSTKTSTFKVTLDGPGKLDGKVSHVTSPLAAYKEGLVPGHTYVVWIQPLVDGAAAGKAGKVTFITRKG